MMLADGLKSLISAGASLDMTNTFDGRVIVDFSFTKGSLTNVKIRFYGSTDDITFDPLHNELGAEMIETLTADGERMYALSLPGVRHFRATVQGNGTVASSLADFTYRYNRNYLSSSQTDGVTRLSS